MTGTKKKWFLLNLLFALMVVFTIGCSATEEKEKDGVSKVETKDTNETNSEQAFPVTVVDGSGDEVTIDSEPETIVSFIPSNTEITFALGQGEKLVGVDDFSNYPAEVEAIEKVGGQEINVEKVLALQPDLILVTNFHHENNQDILTQFKEAGSDVLVVGDAASLDDVYETITLVGEVVGATGEAEKMIADMKSRLSEISEKAKEVTEKKRVWVEVSPAPDIFTTGQNTFMHEMLETINAINTAGEQTGWVKMTEEEIVTLNPDVIITTYGYYVENPSEQVLNRAGWGEVPAIKNEQVFDVENDMVTRPGPRLIDGVETLAKLIYPDVFGE